MQPIWRKRLLTAATTVLVLLVACNPDLLPLVPIVDTMGLDVVVMLLVAQVAAAWPGLRAGVAGLLRRARLLLGL
ncbi:hypothetical protein L0938_11140 [Paracidovorax citrulli]